MKPLALCKASRNGPNLETVSLNAHKLSLLHQSSSSVLHSNNNQYTSVSNQPHRSTQPSTLRGMVK